MRFKLPSDCSNAFPRGSLRLAAGVSIESLSAESIPGVVALQRACFPPPFPEELLWTEAHLRQHLERFPKGQFVARNGFVVGSASALIVAEAKWHAHRSWDDLTGGHAFDGHHPTGTTLYGADISVHPDWQGQGIGRLLYQARFDLVRRLGLRRFGTCCRTPGFQDWAQTHTGGLSTYVDLVVAGVLTDRTLTPLLRMGLCFKGTIEGYLDDEESGHGAAVLEWTP